MHRDYADISATFTRPDSDSFAKVGITTKSA